MAKKNKEFIDDGRTIADMNVEGMPWYQPERKEQNGSAKQNSFWQDELSKAEKRAMMTGIMGAALLIGFIFIAVFFLFILFCTKIWA